MIDLPSWIPPSTNGTPIPKGSRVERKTKKALRVAAEDDAVAANVKAKRPKREGIGPRLRAMVMERDGHACVLCHTRGDTDNPLQIGHVIPVCQGGTNTEDNLRCECRTCNLGTGGRRQKRIKPVTVDNGRIVEQLKALVGKKGRK